MRTSCPFVQNEKLVVLIDGIGQRYGQRPSDVLGINDKRIALDFDIAVAVSASQFEAAEMEKRQTEKPVRPQKETSKAALQLQFNRIKQMQNKAAKYSEGK